MAILKIARMGHPVLRQRAEAVPVDAISSPGVQKLVRDLLETVEEYEGAGLAAPQAHTPLRVLVLELDPERGFEAWINPEITPLVDELAYTFEGCLSVPGLRGLVGRPAEIEVRGYRETGETFHYRLAGYPAVVAQHECDHLDGVLYVERVVPRTLMFLEEYRRFARDAGEEE